MYLKQLLSLDYNKKLIQLMYEASIFGIFASNILGMSFSLYILYAWPQRYFDMMFFYK